MTTNENSFWLVELVFPFFALFIYATQIPNFFFNFQHSVSLCHKGSSSSSINANSRMRHTESKADEAPTVEPVNRKMSMDIHVQTEAVITTKRSAKIHDFCLGIPFGRFLFVGRLLGYIFSRNPTGMVSGGGILALGFFSLKVWRTGRSSLPFILGHTVK